MDILLLLILILESKKSMHNEMRTCAEILTYLGCVQLILTNNKVYWPCSPFLSAQQVKEFFKLVEHFQALLLIISVHCSTWKRNLPHFSSLHKDSFVLTSL